MHKNNKKLAHEKRHDRVRKKISGIKEKPRMSIFRSLKNIYVQLIDDETGHVLLSESTLDSEIQSKVKSGKNIDAAKLVGQAIARKAVNQGIKNVVFDKGGYLYHGKIKALADAARENGLIF